MCPLCPDLRQLDAAHLCHRVNNDLQTVLNILGLLATRVTTAQQLLAEAGPRISALAAVYAVVEATRRLPTLQALAAEIIRRTQARHPLGPQVKLRPVQVQLPLKTASALGLWLGEVLEGGFRGWAGAGEILLETQAGQGRLLLKACGQGRLEEEQGAGSPGMSLARAIAEMQLGGKMELAQQGESWRVELEMGWPPGG